MSTQTKAFAVAVGMMIASGLACHLLAKDSARLDEAVSRVERVPIVVGDWRGREEATDAEAFEQAGARSYWTRTYANQRTKESVLVILMCGRWGKMAVHAPEVCYGGAGYELREQPTPFAIKGASDGPGSHFWTAQFTKKTGVPTSLRLYWGWSAQGVWEASSSPRWQFVGQPFLYKLYVSRDVTGQPSVTPQADPTADFLRKFVPEMNRTLFGDDAG